MSDVVPVFSEPEMTRLGEIMGACRGIRNGLNSQEEAWLVTSQEVLLAAIVFRLERIELKLKGAM